MMTVLKYVIGGATWLIAGLVWWPIRYEYRPGFQAFCWTGHDESQGRVD